MNHMGRSLIECFFMVYKTPSSCFPVISYCVKMRKVESINFRFGGRSTSFCSSVAGVNVGGCGKHDNVEEESNMLMI